MDDPYTPENQTPSPDITPPVSSASNSAPAAPAEPEAITPPAPGQVVSSGSAGGSPSAYGAGPAGGLPPRPQAVVSKGGNGKRGLKVLIIIIILALLGAGGWFAYTKYVKKAPATPATQSKDIPLLKIGIHQADYGGVYPNISDNDYAFSVNAQMFEGLVRYEDTNKIVPDLATDWTNPDDNTWVFTIRKDVKFHDGHTLSPSDVKASLDQAVAGTSDNDQTFADTIASVDLVGGNQVKITTKSPDPTLLNKLTFLYIIDPNLPKGDEPSLAGTGPYEIKAGTKPTNTSFQMVAFDQYHFGRPTTRALTFGNENTKPSLIKAFNAGQFDIAGTINPASVNQAKHATLFKATEADSFYVGFNTVTSSPVQNKLVREAIRYALSTQAIGTANSETITPNSQLIPPSIPGYNPAITPYKQNIAKAKQLLAQAGYPNGLTIRLSVSDQDSAEANEIAKELQQVGITTTIDSHAAFDEFINYFTTGQAEMYAIDYASDTLDGGDIFTTTLPTANYNNPTVTELINQADTTVNPATRLKLLQQASALVDQDIAVVPLGSTSDLWVMNKDYVIHQDTPTGYIPVYFYTVHLK